MLITTRQKKFRGYRSPEQLLAIGGYKSSHSTQEQVYPDIPGTEACVRREGEDQYLFSRTGKRNAFDGRCSRVEDVDYASIDHVEAHRLVREHGLKVRLQKTRTIYKIGNGQVNVDRVSHLGSFIEVRADTDEEIDAIAKALGLPEADLVDESYFELMLKNGFSGMREAIINRYDDTQGMTFGIVSGVLTAAGLMLAVIGDEGSTHLVIKVLLGLAFADSYSDALGQFRSEWTKWDSDFRAALKVGVQTLIGKIVMPVTFVAWFLVLPYQIAVYVSLLWAALILGTHALAEAVARERSLLWHPLLIVSISAVALTLTRYGTQLLDLFYR